jgi:hypothetical protein
MTDRFTSVVTTYGPKLAQEFDLDNESVAAVFGNLAHESGAFRLLQEIRPTVKGSRGGYGWPQWTGPRRRAYEAWCSTQKLNPASDDANYGYLVKELKDDYHKAFPRNLVIQHTLYSKVVAFERLYERAGVRAYKSRYAYAKRALAVLKSSVAIPTPTPRPDPR